MKNFAFLLAMFAAGTAWADGATVKELQFEYATKGAGPKFSAEAGKTFFHNEVVTEGEKRSCTTCHTSDLRTEGKEARTGKAIAPLAPSINNKRLTRPYEVEKWFHRNCKWTLGRDCSPQEKGDILAYLNSL